ncbi:MAG: peptidase associated/transthyretin-like domain-containing protein, partial [Planctomycetota bacterium]
MKALVVLILTLGLSVSTAFAQGGIDECAADVTGDNVVDVDDLVAVILDWGCMGPDCLADVNGDEVVNVDDLVEVILEWGCMSTGTLANLSGVVTNVLTGAPIEGASVFVGGIELVTNAMGEYSGDFDPDSYALSYEAQYFDTYEDSIILFPGFSEVIDVALDPVANVVVELSESGDPTPGASVMALAEIIILDGSTIDTMMWMQIGGASVMLTNADTDTATVDLGSSADYKAELLHVLAEPPIGPEDLPENVPPPPGEFPGGLQDRYQVVAINPFSLEETGLVTLGFDVVTTSGTYGDELEIHTSLPWKVSSGLLNVPIDAPVLLYGKEQMAYDWSMTVPGGSGAALADATTQSPEFVPDVGGLYTVSVTDEVTMETVELPIYAGTWRGIIVGQDENGRPTADPACLGCHNPSGAPAEDNFTPWAQTGHAEIFTNNLNTSSYYNPGCFSCHLVGYDLTSDNNGADEQSDYGAFLASGLLGNPSPDNWTNMLAMYPNTAKQANVQCEQCHGPQDGSNAHAGSFATIGDPRVSLSSNVCGQCHGEPLRHARFQQWQLSAHANYDVAIDESESGNCSRCHTANGFLEWLPILLGDEPGDPLDDITVTWTP